MTRAPVKIIYPLSEVAETAKLLATLSDPTRLRLVLTLANGTQNVTSLCEQLELPQPTVSHHLGILRMLGIVLATRDGKSMEYALGADIITTKTEVVFSTGVSIKR